MPVVISAIVRLEDWGPGVQTSHERLSGCALRAGATRCLLLRNLHDAAEALLLIDLPDHDALRVLSVDVSGERDELLSDCMARCRVWQQVLRDEGAP